VIDSRQRQHWPRAAVFDFDGTLVDSAHCWHHAYRAVAGENGGTVAGAEFDDLAGVSVAAAAAHLSRRLAVPIDEARLRRALHDSVAAHPPPALPGARALVVALAARMPLAVASNAPRDVIVGALERLGLHDAFDVILSAEQTAAHKPAPDVYLEACRRLPVHPSDAIAFEDSPLGAEAARAAGLFVVAVSSVPGPLIDADLTVRHLDDPLLLHYLGVRRPQITAPRCRRSGGA
jgi:HAD superfamily hydrolase (TIGR01509 family)